MRPGTMVDFFDPEDRPQVIRDPTYFSRLPAPDPYLPKDEQREAFCGAHGGPRSVAEADFEKWWVAHRAD